jgi:hypothetical protein
MNQSPWSALLSLGFSTFLSIPISMIAVKSQDNLVAFRKEPRLRNRVATEKRVGVHRELRPILSRSVFRAFGPAGTRIVIRAAPGFWAVRGLELEQRNKIKTLDRQNGQEEGKH